MYKIFEETFKKEDTRMASISVKRCSTSLVIREMQSETLKYHYAMAKIKMAHNRSSRVAQGIKDPVLSLQWLRSLLWHRFVDPWPWILPHPTACAAKKKKPQYQVLVRTWSNLNSYTLFENVNQTVSLETSNFL